MKEGKKMEVEKILELIVKTLDKKKATDIQVLGIEDLTVLSDYFVIATASNTTLLKALANEVEYELEKVEVKCHSKEGFESNTWILLDFGNVIVHLFLNDSRAFYSLERLWTDAKQIDIQSFLEEE